MHKSALATQDKFDPISTTVDEIHNSAKTVNAMERDWSNVVEKTLSENEFANNAKRPVVFYNIPDNTPENYVRSKRADNNAVQQSFNKISVKGILVVRRVGKMESSNTSKPRSIEITLKNEFDRMVVLICACNL